MSEVAPLTVIASRYRVVRELGRGGMGVVYVVEHVHTGDHLALKLLLGQASQDAQAVERFKREARASARIKSEHVVRVMDADTAADLGGAPFLVMELLNGQDLEKRLETGGRMSPEEALHYLGQAANALDRSHSAGIVHRDLKPENLFLHTKEDGTTLLKILDFGISKLLGEGGNDLSAAGATKTGSVMGTPLYMSPEQARGRVNEIGPATDIWAMGLIAMQLLTGEVYWRATTMAELMVAILAEPLYDPSTRWTGLPVAVDAWFAKSCAREPRDRFASVGEQMAALRGALFGQAIPGGDRASGASGASGLPAGAAVAVTNPSYGAMVGTRTTTGTVSQVQPGGAPTKRTGSIVAGAIVGLGIAAAAAFGVMKATQTGATTAVVDPATSAGPAAMTVVAPAVTASTTAPALSAANVPTASASVNAVPATSVPPVAPVTAGHPTGRGNVVTPPKPSAAPATPAVPEKRTPAPRYDPTSL